MKVIIVLSILFFSLSAKANDPSGVEARNARYYSGVNLNLKNVKEKIVNKLENLPYEMWKRQGFDTFGVSVNYEGINIRVKEDGSLVIGTKAIYFNKLLTKRLKYLYEWIDQALNNEEELKILLEIMRK